MDLEQVFKSNIPPVCPTIIGTDLVKVIFYDDQGRRCTTWKTAQEIGDMWLKLHPMPVPPPSRLVPEWRYPGQKSSLQKLKAALQSLCCLTSS